MLSCLLLSSCAGLVPVEASYDELKPPGFFDIGYGYGRVLDTRNTDDDDAEGQIVSFKAYPGGRWYGEPKESKRQTGVTPSERVAASILRDLGDGVRTSYFRLLDAGKSEAEFAAFDARMTTFLAAPAAQRFGISAAEDLLDDGKRTSALNGVAAAAGAPVAAWNTMRGAESDAQFLDHVRVYTGVNDRVLVARARATLEGLLTNPLASIPSNQVVALTRLVTAADLSEDQGKAVGDFLGAKELAPNWHIVSERNHWYNRLSVFYGRSVADFDSGGLDSAVNVVGVGFDVSPDLALQLGYGFYEVDETGNGDADSDGSLFFGVSLNLFAFRSLASAISGAASN
ncbi:MAG: hypothetical protein AAFQ53_05175 [Bacteroidota bacterium]